MNMNGGVQKIKFSKTENFGKKFGHWKSSVLLNNQLRVILVNVQTYWQKKQLFCQKRNWMNKKRKKEKDKQKQWNLMNWEKKKANYLKNSCFWACKKRGKSWKRKWSNQNKGIDYFNDFESIYLFLENFILLHKIFL